MMGAGGSGGLLSLYPSPREAEQREWAKNEVAQDCGFLLVHLEGWEFQ